MLSIISTKQKDLLLFSEVAVSEIAKEISKLKENKASQISNVLINVIKGSSDVYSDFLFKSFNTSFTLFHKKVRDYKGNCRPFSITADLS